MIFSAQFEKLCVGASILLYLSKHHNHHTYNVKCHHCIQNTSTYIFQSKSLLHLDSGCTTFCIFLTPHPMTSILPGSSRSRA